MKNSEAVEILQLLTAGFHREDLEPGTIELWVAILEPMDAATASVVALSWIKSQDRFPTISQFRHTYHGLRQRSKQELSAAHATDEHGLPTTGEPTWIKRWRVARANNDFRVFPEQIVGESKYSDDPRYTRAEAEEIGIMPEEAWA